MMKRNPDSKRKVNTENENESVHKNKKIHDTKLCDDHYDQPCEDLAKFLLGKVLVRKINDNVLVKGRIVETECYLGGEDKASHSYNGRKTDRNEPMFMKPGTAYVYMTYGMYFCFNISSREPGSAVLLRSLEPIEGLDYMFTERGKKKKTLKSKELCNGPSKLCISLNISKDTCNKLDLCQSDLLWVENDNTFDNKFEIVTTSRIGIDSAGEEWANKPLRFYILSNEYVSKRDKTIEKIIRDRLEAN